MRTPLLTTMIACVVLSVACLPSAKTVQPPGNPPPGNPPTVNPPPVPPGSNDATLMRNWVHRDGRWFSYFVPNNDWQASESANGIDISSPTGDEIVSYGYGPRQMTLQQVAQFIFQGVGITNVMIVNQQQPVNFSGYVAQTVEFTGVIRTGVAIQGVLTAQTSDSWFGAYICFAPVPVWQRDSQTMLAIRSHITNMGRSPQ